MLWSSEAVEHERYCGLVSREYTKRCCVSGPESGPVSGGRRRWPVAGGRRSGASRRRRRSNDDDENDYDFSSYEYRGLVACVLVIKHEQQTFLSFGHGYSGHRTQSNMNVIML